MTDYYLATALSSYGELARARSPHALLVWAAEVAKRARPEDIYRNKEGEKPCVWNTAASPTSSSCTAV